MAENNDIIINLKKVRDAQILNEEEIIQRDALEQFKEIIKRIFEHSKHENPDNDKSKTHKRHHDVIMIDGERGSGKTTFVLSILELLRKGKLFSDNSDFKIKVKSLDILDPTLLTGKPEYIFITIISQITEAVKKHIRSNDNLDDDDTNNWNKKLSELARGLASMDGLGTELFKKELWNDYQYILQEGLIDASHSIDLANKFHQFVVESLKLLDREVFIIAFDDIDTAFQSGWPVLEVIRRYLTTPKLLVVLAGDLDLYRALVLKTQIEMIGKELRDEKVIELEQIETLTEQYLLKLLKPEYLIRLENLGFYSRNCRVIHLEQNDQASRESDDEKSKPLDDVLELMCQYMFFIHSESEIRQLKESFLNLPTRSLIHILRNYSIACNEQWELKDKYSIVIPDFYNKFIYVFQLSLSKYRKLIYKLKASNSLFFIEELLRDNDLELLNDLMGLYTAPLDELNFKEAVFISSQIAFLMKLQPASYFDFIIKIGLTKRIIELEKEGYIVPDLGKDIRAIAVAKKFASFVREIRLDQQHKRPLLFGTIWVLDRDSKETIIKEIGFGQIVKHKSAILKIPIEEPYSEEIEKFFDAIDKASSDEASSKMKIAPSKINRSSSESYNTLPELEKAIKSEHNVFIGLISSFIRSRYRNGDYYYFVSIFDLFGVVSIILDTVDTEKMENEFRNFLWDFSFFDFKANHDEQYKIVLKRKTDIDKIGKVDKKFNTYLVDWKKKAHDLPILPIHIIVQIVDSFINSISGFDSSYEDRDLFIGKLFHKFIITFLNSILIQELMYYDSIIRIDLNLNNPALDNDEVFIKNIKAWEAWKKQDKHRNSVFEFFFTCPVWGLFLKPDGTENSDQTENSVFERYKAHVSSKKDFTKSLEVTYKKGDFQAKFDNLYYPLNSVLVPKTQKEQKSEEENT